jgi:hypothetical protein
MKPLRNVAHLLFALALAAAVGCTSDSPTEPSVPPSNPKPPVPVTTYAVTVTASPTQLTAGSTTPSTITVQVRATDTGQPPPDLTNVTLTTTLGEFGSAGSGQKTVTLQLVNGRAQTALFPGTDIGTATIRADVAGSSGAANVGIGQAATFFISSINPAVGNPQGGQEVVITGGGFSGPVRVTFNGAAASVKSVTATQIRAVVPSATAAGVTVGVGEAKPVTVGVTIHYNEAGQLSDNLPNGFTYALGGTVQPQIFSVTPASGTNDGGTQVTIIGDGFQSPVQVFFGLGGSAGSFDGVEATVNSVTPTRIVVTTPSARGFGQNLVNQLVNVLVKNLNTGFSTVSQQAFKYGNKVLITSMGPGSGPYTGGTRVTIFGQGFDDPVAVSIGGVGQQVISTTGSEIVILTSGVPVSACPANGLVTVTGVSVTNIETGDTGTANLGFNYVVPLPLVFGVNPSSGSIGATITISGQSFGSNVQVIFGDPTNGSSAPIVSHTGTTIQAKVPTPATGFVYNTEPCDGNGDGIPNGTRNAATPISVTVRNLDGTGCVVTLTNGFVLNPPNVTCTGDNSVPPTPQCSDGIDNDGDGLIDFGPAATNDPGCTSASDNSEG